MSITGKIVGAVLGLLLFRNPWGAIIGLILGHFYDQSVSAQRRSGGGAGVLEIGERFFAATFEVMGHVAKSDGHVSEAEIAAARKVMAELRLNGAQIHAAIAHFTRGKNPDFDLESAMRQFAEAVADRPDLMRVFLEVQVRASLEGVDMQGPARMVIQKVADLLDVSRIELAHMEAVLRIRREQFRTGGGPRSGGAGAGGQAPPRSGMQLHAAYQILEVDSKATNEEVAKAYRRQLSKHHPDKLKANGLPESMLEHAKQRTQQIIEAYELIKSSRGA
ncbi:MAG TPA: co-chaperone DjlA [Steroidobacteraceae bacterium]|jgi:DnaJ like chaperone protein|nr:co-chaperone DjlA [Steroidobacteraceae bacterium]